MNQDTSSKIEFVNKLTINPFETTRDIFFRDNKKYKDFTISMSQEFKKHVLPLIPKELNYQGGTADCFCLKCGITDTCLKIELGSQDSELVLVADWAKQITAMIEHNLVDMNKRNHRAYIDSSGNIFHVNILNNHYPLIVYIYEKFIRFDILLLSDRGFWVDSNYIYK